MKPHWYMFRHATCERCANQWVRRRRMFTPKPGVATERQEHRWERCCWKCMALTDIDRELKEVYLPAIMDGLFQPSPLLAFFRGNR